MTDNPWLKPPEIEAVLAVGALTLFGGVTASVMFNVVPPANEKYAMLMLGALIGVVKDTFGRYFQATKGSAEQRKDAADVAKTLAETAAVTAAAAVSQAATPAPPIVADTIAVTGDSVTVTASDPLSPNAGA
jgi:hypothetical protein